MWGRALVLLLLAGFAWSCGRMESGRLGTGRSVRQEKIRVAEGLGGYRSVKMPEKAKRNLVESDPRASGAADYLGSVSDR